MTPPKATPNRKGKVCKPTRTIKFTSGDVYVPYIEMIPKDEMMEWKRNSPLGVDVMLGLELKVLSTNTVVEFFKYSKSYESETTQED